MVSKRDDLRLRRRWLIAAAVGVVLAAAAFIAYVDAAQQFTVETHPIIMPGFPGRVVDG